MMLRAVRAELLRAKAMHLLCWIVLGYFAIAALYLVGPDVWASVTSPLGVQGFYANPQAVTTMVERYERELSHTTSGDDTRTLNQHEQYMAQFVAEVDVSTAPAAAALAHSLPFLFLVILLGGHVAGAPIEGRAGTVSCAHGESSVVLLAARTVALLLCFMGVFALFSLVAYVALMGFMPGAMTLGGWMEFGRRLALCSLVCAAFIVLVSLVAGTFGRGAYVLGSLVLLTFIGYSNPNLIYMHISALMRLCSPVPIDAFQIQIIVFSLGSSVVAAAAAYAIAKIREVIA